MIYEDLNFFPRVNNKLFPDFLVFWKVFNFSPKTLNVRLPIVFKTLKFKNFSLFLLLHINESSFSILRSRSDLSFTSSLLFWLAISFRRCVDERWEGTEKILPRCQQEEKKNEKSMFFSFHFQNITSRARKKSTCLKIDEWDRSDSCPDRNWIFYVKMFLFSVNCEFKMLLENFEKTTFPPM